MRKFSWYTIIHPDWHKGEPPLFRLVGPAILPDERTCDIYFKPNMKGGHRHNHIRNAHKRMRKCHVCDDPIVWGCEVISDWTNAEFMCRECCRNDAKDYCSAVGLHFGGVTFQTRRKKK